MSFNPSATLERSSAVRVISWTIAASGWLAAFWHVNAKRVYRIYKEEGLMVRTKARKKISRRRPLVVALATGPNQRWSMDFVAERLDDGRKFRVLTVVDQFTRECVALYAKRFRKHGV